MSFDAIVDGVRVLPGLAADDKWTALRDLCRFAADEGVIPAAIENDVLAAVVDREKSLSTGMEKGLAVPHAFVAAIDSPVLILAVAPAGIPWDALDGAPAVCIAMLIAPSTSDARSAHLQALARLSGMWCDEGRRASLRAATDVESVRAVLRTA